LSNTGLGANIEVRFNFWLDLLSESLGFLQVKCENTSPPPTESWQQVGALMTSKAELSSFALEVMKKMGMRYHTPSKPVELTFMNSMNGLNKTVEPPEFSFSEEEGGGGGGDEAMTPRRVPSDDFDMESVEAMFT
jgi:hypothetical protein